MGELWEMDGENWEHRVSMAFLLICASVGASVCTLELFLTYSAVLSSTVSLSRTCRSTCPMQEMALMAYCHPGVFVFVSLSIQRALLAPRPWRP